MRKNMDCECSCGWGGNHDQLGGEYPNLTCPRCGEPAATHIHDVCADDELDPDQTELFEAPYECP